MKQATNNDLAKLIISIDKRVTETQGELREFVGFVKGHMVTHQDLDERLAKTKYEIIDAFDRKLTYRDQEIGNIKSAVKHFHPTAFPKPKTAS